MTPSVSTSGRTFSCGLFLEGCRRLVLGGVVGGVVGPAGVDDAGPGAGEDSDGVGVVAASLDGALVDVGGPGTGVAGVVGEGRHRPTEPFVAGPAELNGVMFPGFLGDGG